MKRILALTALWLAAAVLAHGQVSNPSVRYVAGAPSGACAAAPPIQIVISTGVMYTCNNGTWGAIGSGTATNMPWSGLTAPTTTLALSIAPANVTTFTWTTAASPTTTNWTWTGAADSGTSTTPVFIFQDTTGNTRTGPMLDIHSVGTSTALPVRITAQGQSNGVSMSAAGLFAPLGTGAIYANQVATTSTSAASAFYPLFVASSSNGFQAPSLNSAFTYTPSTNTLTATTFSGALNGTASGNGTVSGQANGVIPLATAATAIGAQSHLSDDGSTVSSSEDFCVGVACPTTGVTIGALGSPTNWDFDTTTAATALASLGGQASGTYVTPTTLSNDTLAASVTTLAASSTVSGTGFSTYLASPPAIGGTAPAVGTFTSVTIPADGVHPSDYSFVGNTTAPTINANTFHLTGPPAATFTAYGWQVPVANPAANQVVAIGAPDAGTHEAPISYLSNATTVNGATCTLGSTCSPPGTVLYQATVSTGLQANQTGTAIYTVPSGNAWYTICLSEMITQAASSSSTLPYPALNYVSAVSSATVLVSIPGGGDTGNTTNVAAAGCVTDYIKSATAITYSTFSYASSGGTVMQYAVNATVKTN